MLFPLRSHKKSLALLLSLGASISLVVSACSSSNSPNAATTAASNASPASTTNSASNPVESNTVRIGYQKYGTLFLLKARGNLDQQFKAQGIAVQWIQFPAGPQLLEALNTGSIDYGSTGETPPIFAQAAGAPLVYVAHEPPDPKGEAILVAKGSPIQTVADLKGKKVALNKGSNVHYLLVQALADVGLQYSDVQVVYLPPADARAAFEKGDVEAWVIWEPYLTAAQKALGARVLKDGEGLAANRQFYLASKSFTEQHPDRVKTIIEETQKVNEWTQGNFTQAAAILSPQIGIDPSTLTEILKGRPYGIQQPLKPDVVSYQQQVADTFVKLKLLPKPIKVQEVAQSSKQ